MAGAGEHVGARDMSLPPTDELSWPEFEDFVEAVLSAHRFSIGDGVRITAVDKWGRPGDKQHGIDLKGQWSNAKTAVWQCKRYRRLPPAAVVKAVKACDVEADEHYLVFSGIASPLAQNKIADYPGWQILDRRGLAQLLSDLPLQRQRQILDKTWDPSTRRRILALPGADSFETIDSLATLRRSPTPLNDRGSFVGRENEREVLASSLESDEAAAVIITGSGGMGKSRLAVEVLQAFQRDHPTIPVLSLIEGHDLQGGSLDELPHTPAVLFVDDGDDRIGAVEHLTQYAIRNPQTHLVITCRKQRAAVIQDLLLHARLPTNCIETIDVGPLTAREAGRVVDDLTEDLGLSYPGRRAIARLTEEAPFLGVLTVNLVRSGDLSGNLSLNQGLRSEVLAGYRRSLRSAFEGHAPEKVEHLLATCAALGPIDPKDTSIRSALSRFTRIPDAELTRLLTALTDAGILRRDYSGLRVVPDILADVLLEEASFNDSLDLATGFIDQLWTDFYPVRATQLLRQLTNLSWRLQNRGRPSCIEGIWETIRNDIDQADHVGLIESVDRMQNMCYTAPVELVSLLDGICIRISTLDAESSGDVHTGTIDGEQLHPGSVSAADVLKALPPLYAQCARSKPDLFEQALDALWSIHQVLARPTSWQPTEAAKAADTLLSAASLSSDSFPRRAVARVSAWAAEWSDGYPASPFFLLKPLLAKHGETTKQTAARILSIEPYLINASWARPHRDTIRELLGTYSAHENVSLAAQAVRMLEEALQRPFAMGGLTPDADESARWEADDLKTIEVLRDAASQTSFAVIRRLVRAALAWHAQLGAAESRHAALTVVTELDNRSDDDLAQVLLHSQGFGLRLRRHLPVPSVDQLREQASRPREVTDDEYSAWEDERLEQSRLSVDRLWHTNSTGDALDTLEHEYDSVSKAVGDRASLSDIGRCLSTERADLGREIVDNLALRAPGVLDSLLVPAFSGWHKTDENSLLEWLNNFEHQRDEVRKSIGTALGGYGWVKGDQRFGNILDKGRRDRAPAVRAEFHRASHKLFIASPGDVARSLIDEGIQAAAATDLLRWAALHSQRNWIQTLRIVDVGSVLDLASRADVNDFGIQVMLAKIAAEHPRITLDFLTKLSSRRAKLSHGPNALVESLKRRPDVVANWIIEAAATSEAMDVVDVVSYVGNEILDVALLTILSESALTLSDRQLQNVLEILRWGADFWPLKCPLLAQRVFQRLSATAPEHANAVKQRVSDDATRPLMLSWCNGQSEQLDQALPLAVECTRAESDPELLSMYEAAAIAIQNEIVQLRERYEEDVD